MSFVKAAAIILFSGALAACGQSVARTAGKTHTPEEAESVKSALVMLGNGVVPNYKIGWSDLNADGEQEAIVLMMGADWCGTGGCTLIVLKKNVASWRVISKTPTSRAPVELLNGKTNGWFDLAVMIQGGGDLARKKALLKFQSNGYVKHPEMATEGVRQVIIP